jgi:MFS transporter, DHA2 family, multidrug resistance protein
MEVLDVTIVNVSLRHIAGGVAASLDESTWIVTSYLVSNARRWRRSMRQYRHRPGS